MRKHSEQHLDLKEKETTLGPICSRGKLSEMNWGQFGTSWAEIRTLNTKIRIGPPRV